jgi:V-type H+-transporting ATPase subunit C
MMFKIGSLDLLVSLADHMGKLDHQLESIIRKIERQHLEIEPEVKLIIDSPNHGVTEAITPESYLATFQWNAAKFPSGKSLTELIGIVQVSMHQFDDEIKHKLAKYLEAKNAVAALSKRESGNLFSKDLAEVLRPGVVEASDFINTANLVTAIAVVPQRDVQRWISSYEKLDDYVVPRCTKEFYTDTRDNLTLWRIIVLRPRLEDLTNKARENKWAIREFTFDPNYFDKQQETKSELETALGQHTEGLRDQCKVSFSELFIGLMHLKAIRVYVESVLRYSLPPNFLSFCVKPEPGREKRILDSLIRRFLRPGETVDMYTTREEDEGEEFYPFVLVKIGVPTV